MSKKQTFEKRRPARQEERKVSRCWNKSCLIHIAQKLQCKYTEHIHRTKLIRQNDATTRKLNRQYNIQLVVTKTRFFHDTLPWNVICTTKTQLLTSFPLLNLFLLIYMKSIYFCTTHDINMTVLWWMDVAKSRYQIISSSRGFLSRVSLWSSILI